MSAELMIESASYDVLHLVSDFAHGAGCDFTTASGPAGGSVRIQLPESSAMMLELLSHLALSATKANVALDEPVCRVTVRHPNASGIVRMAFRISEFDIESAAAATS